MRTKISLRNKKIIWITFILWLAIYDPPIILKFNIIHVIGACSWIYILKYKKITKSFKVCIFFTIFLYFYYVFVKLFYQESEILTSYHIYWLVDIIPLAYTLSSYLKRECLTFRDFENTLIFAGLISSLLTILALIFPSVREFFLIFFLKAGYSAEYFKEFGFRTLGFAYNLQYSSSIVQGFIALLTLNKGLREDKKINIFWTCILVFSGFINARTTLVIFLVGLVFVLYFNRKKIIKVIFYAVTIILIIMISMFILQNMNSTLQIKWLLDGYYDLLSLFTDNYSARYSIKDYYSSKHIIFPNSIQTLMFGTGTYIVGKNRFALQSDIGYVNDIWLCGLFYTLFLYGSFFKLCNKMKNKIKLVSLNQSKLIYFIILTTIALSNIKWMVFSFNSISTLIWIVCFVISNLEYKQLNL